MCVYIDRSFGPRKTAVPAPPGHQPRNNGVSHCSFQLWWDDSGARPMFGLSRYKFVLVPQDLSEDVWNLLHLLRLFGCRSTYQRPAVPFPRLAPAVGGTMEIARKLQRFDICQGCSVALPLCLLIGSHPQHREEDPILSVWTTCWELLVKRLASNGMMHVYNYYQWDYKDTTEIFIQTSVNRKVLHMPIDILLVLWIN